MENQFAEIYHQDAKYQIIGQQGQVLQLLLLPEESIKTKVSYIQYYSTNLKYIQENLGGMLRIFTGSSEEVKLTNNSKSGGYVGISRCTGKILVMDIVVMMNYWVKENNVIAMTSNVELQKKKGLPFTLKTPSTLRGVGPFRKVVLNQDSLHRSQLLFMQANNTLIEKELGAGETINLRSDSVLAFSEKIQVEINQSQVRFSTFSGPGRIYFEGVTAVQHNNQNLINQSKMIFLMSVLFTILFTWGLAMEVLMEDII